MLNVVCAFRSGGDFTMEYVTRLADGVRAGLTRHEYEFHCVTDFKVPFRNDIIRRYFPRLFPGWWSKLQCFDIHGPALYLDLDTIIVGSLNRWADAVCGDNHDLWLLEELCHTIGIDRPDRQWGTGLMAWRGDWRWLHHAVDPVKDFERCRRGDQQYVAEAMQEAKLIPRRIQGVLNVASYKWQCRGKGPPPGTDVVCYHGHPRPHETGWAIK